MWCACIRQRFPAFPKQVDASAAALAACVGAQPKEFAKFVAGKAMALGWGEYDGDVAAWGRDVFERSEMNGDDALNPNEFHFATYVISEDITAGKFTERRFVAQMFRAMDANRDDKITEEEATVAIARRQRGAKESVAREVALGGQPEGVAPHVAAFCGPTGALVKLSKPHCGSGHAALIPRHHFLAAPFRPSTLSIYLCLLALRLYPNRQSCPRLSSSLPFDLFLIDSRLFSLSLSPLLCFSGP